MPIRPVLLTLAGIPAHQFTFLSVLLPRGLATCGAHECQKFQPLQRLERTLRRHFQAALPWHNLHLSLVKLLVRCRAVVPRFMLVMDARFIPKSGTKTTGLGAFWNSCVRRAETGLELSCIAQHPKRRGGRRKWQKNVDLRDFDGWASVPADQGEVVWTRVV